MKMNRIMMVRIIKDRLWGIDNKEEDKSTDNDGKDFRDKDNTQRMRIMMVMALVRIMMVMALRIKIKSKG